MDKAPYDQRLARPLARALAACRVHPNAVTAFTLILALAAAWLFADGGQGAANWAAGLFVLSRFLDHLDGELARLTNTSSKLGYYLDYASGAFSYGALFLGIALGLSKGSLGSWALALGALAGLLALIAALLNISLDRLEDLDEGEAVGYPGLAGFELEDGIYLLAPITWIGALEPFFVAAVAGTVVYALWTSWRVLRGRARRRS